MSTNSLASDDYSSSGEDSSIGSYGDSDAMPMPDEVLYPGLVLKGDYLLLKKIDAGNNASVWICYQISTFGFSAMKIQDYECYNDGCREVAVIKEINEYCASNQINSHCIRMLDYFVYKDEEDSRGNEIKHVCSVYDLYAGSLQMLLSDGIYKYGFPINVVKRITTQLLSSLVILHDKLHIIHTDIKPDNILVAGTQETYMMIIEMFIRSEFQTKYEGLKEIFADDQTKFLEELEILALDSVKDIDSLYLDIRGSDESSPTDSEIESDSEIVEGENDSGSDGDYGYTESDEDTNDKFNERRQSIDDVIENLDYSEVHSLDDVYDHTRVLNNRANSEDHKIMIDDVYVQQNCETVLTDFGNAYFFKKRTRNEVQARKYRAPEVILDLNYGYSCDIWSVCCTVYELLTGFALFDPCDNPLNKDIHHLYLMEKIIGEIPVHMKKNSKRSKFLFDKSRKYHIKNVSGFQTISIKQKLLTQHLFSEDEATEIEKFLLQGLVFDPSKRATAKEMLESEWLRSN